MMLGAVIMTMAAGFVTVSGARREALEPAAPVSLVFGGTDPRGVRVETPAGLAGPRTLVLTVESQMLARGECKDLDTLGVGGRWWVVVGGGVVKLWWVVEWVPLGAFGCFWVLGAWCLVLGGGWWRDPKGNKPRISTRCVNSGAPDGSLDRAFSWGRPRSLRRRAAHGGGWRTMALTSI